VGQQTLLKESHQSWKLYVGALAMVAGWWLDRRVDLARSFLLLSVSWALTFGGGF
jgi:hypothetical protein